MRLLHVTDLHYHWPWFRWVQREARKYAAVCVTGDFLDMFNRRVPHEKQADDVCNWLAGFRTPIFVCSGNHDWVTSTRGELANAGFLRPGNSAVRSDGTDELFNGYRFICGGWCETLKRFEGQVPIILLSHAPPINTCLSTVGLGTNDLGDAGVRAAAESLPPRSLLLSGHVHERQRWYERVGNAWAFNPGFPSSKSGAPQYIVLDFGKGIAAFIGERFRGSNEADTMRLW